MAPTKSKRPLVWEDVRDDGGAVLGRYAVSAGMITVRSAQGWEKRTQLGNTPATSLARVILMEAPPLGWQAPPR